MQSKMLSIRIKRRPLQAGLLAGLKPKLASLRNRNARAVRRMSASPDSTTHASFSTPFEVVQARLRTDMTSRSH